MPANKWELLLGKKAKKNLRKTGFAGSFVAGLELVREGDLLIKQEKLFDRIFYKVKNEKE